MSSHRMDDLAELCSDVTILSTGRVVFTGPLAKLAAEIDELDYRLLASASTKAATVAAGIPGLRVLETGDALIVRGPVTALDDLVFRLVGAGIGVRELAPVMSPLEAAFLALTDSGSDR